MWAVPLPLAMDPTRAVSVIVITCFDRVPSGLFFGVCTSAEELSGQLRVGVRANESPPCRLTTLGAVWRIRNSEGAAPALIRSPAKMGRYRCDQKANENGESYRPGRKINNSTIS